mgnify:CR=1 FL=1
MSQIGGIGKRYGIFDPGVDNVPPGKDTREPSYVMARVVHPWVYLLCDHEKAESRARQGAERA